MLVRLSVMDDQGVASRDLTPDDIDRLVEALKRARYDYVKTGGHRLPKGIEVAPV